MGNDYSRLITDTPTYNIDYDSGIMRQNVALFKLVIPPPYTQVLVKAVTRKSNLIHTKPQSSLWTGRCIHSATEVHEVFPKKALKILFLTSLPLRGNHLKKWLVAMQQKVQIFA